MKKIIMGCTTVILVLIGVMLYQNNFDMKLEDEVLETKEGKLQLEYALPQKKTKEKPGIIFFIHGDGPTTKNADEGYYPAWEVLAKENYISVSWDKRGVGNSEGNWLSQNMVDREKEANDVIEWALTHFDIDKKKVGVWGASQGGWVIPKVLNHNNKVTFAIGVAPAVNWLRQGRYNTIAAMKEKGKTETEIEAKLKKEEIVNNYLEKDDYDGYLESKCDDEPLSKERWDFIVKNMSLDVTNDLKKITKPYHLIIGDADINVDVSETEKVYKEELPGDSLTVHHVKNGTHQMLKKRHQTTHTGTVLEAIWNPRQIFSPDYFKALKESLPN